MNKYFSPKPISTHLLWGLLIGICVGTIGCGLSSFSLRQDWASAKTMITQQQLLTHLDEEPGLLILDVRTSAEYASGHIPGAVNIPIQELSQRLDELAEYDMQFPMVIYCERGVRADRGRAILQEAGFVTIQHLEGDMQAWREHDRPIEISGLDGNAREDSTSSISESASSITFASPWIVSPDQALSLIQQGAVLLDAQGKGFGLKRFSGATVVSWQQFSQTESPHRGKLLEEEKLTQRLQEVGVSGDRPVVVFANPPQGWGEDGRIVWMLRTLGHSQAVMVDGGINALLAAQSQLPERVTVAPVERGDFVVQRQNMQSTGDPLDWTIQKEELQALLSHQPILIDTREPREYAGETPYGEQRGGHLPGAIHLYFKDLLTEDGSLLPEADLRATLQTYGITPDRRAIAYCTGGIRSGWLTAVLVHYGYQVENYAGSMWEWSAAPPERYPLIREPG